MTLLAASHLVDADTVYSATYNEDESAVVSVRVGADVPLKVEPVALLHVGSGKDVGKLHPEYFVQDGDDV